MVTRSCHVARGAGLRKPACGSSYPALGGCHHENTITTWQLPVAMQQRFFFFLASLAGRGLPEKKQNKHMATRPAALGRFLLGVREILKSYHVGWGRQMPGVLFLAGLAPRAKPEKHLPPLLCYVVRGGFFSGSLAGRGLPEKKQNMHMATRPAG